MGRGGLWTWKSWEEGGSSSFENYGGDGGRGVKKTVPSVGRGVWIFSGITHCPFRRTDYSLLVSSCPLRGLFFLSCNDVISLDFPLSIHDSIIVKEKKNFWQGNPVSCRINRPLASYLSPSKRDLNAFWAFMLIVIVTILKKSFSLRLLKDTLTNLYSLICP